MAKQAVPSETKPVISNGGLLTFKTTNPNRAKEVVRTSRRKMITLDRLVGFLVEYRKPKKDLPTELLRRVSTLTEIDRLMAIGLLCRLGVVNYEKPVTDAVANVIDFFDVTYNELRLDGTTFKAIYS